MTAAPRLMSVAKPQTSDAVPLAFERRRSDRHSVSGRVTALQTTSTGQGLLRKICPLVLLDISQTGLGALCQEPIEPGSTLTVYFPPHGPERGFDASGRVVRCVQRGSRHQIGIRFDARPAA